jgi:hypothetical protein
MTCLAPKFSSFLHRHCNKHSQMCRQIKIQLLCDVCGMRGRLWLHGHEREGTMILQNVGNNPILAHPTNPESSVTSLWQPQMVNFVGICFAHYLIKRTELMMCNSFHFADTKPQGFDLNFHIHILLHCWRFFLYNCKSWPFVSGPHWMTKVTVQSLPTCCNILYNVEWQFYLRI